MAQPSDRLPEESKSGQDSLIVRLIDFAASMTGIEKALAFFALFFLIALVVLTPLGDLKGLEPLYVLVSLFLVVIVESVLVSLRYVRKSKGDSPKEVDKETELKNAEERKDWDRVIELCQTLLEEHEDNLDYRARLSQAYMQRAQQAGAYIDIERLREALDKDYKPALQCYPYNFDARIRAAFAYHILDEVDEAIAHYNYALVLKDTQSLNIPPDKFIWALGSRGWVYFDVQMYEQAIEDFSRVLRESPRNAWAYMKRGEAYRAIGNYELAKEDHIKSTECDPDAGTYYGNVGKAYLLLRKPFEAYSWYSKGFEKNKKIINNGWMAQWSLFCLDSPFDKSQVAQELQTIASQDPKNSMSDLCCAVASWLCGEQGRAEPLLRIFVDKYSGFWDGHFWIGVMEASQNHADAAMNALKTALAKGMPPVLLLALRRFASEAFLTQYGAEVDSVSFAKGRDGSGISEKDMVDGEGQFQMNLRSLQR
jgi:tetratricopeptide (TPR) repeat protein